VRLLRRSGEQLGGPGEGVAVPGRVAPGETVTIDLCLAGPGAAEGSGSAEWQLTLPNETLMGEPFRVAFAAAASEGSEYVLVAGGR
jgi:hypothetical protein